MPYIPEELFKRRRRHNNTPESTMLIIVNFIVVAVSVSWFTDKSHINWFFWVVVGLLGLYNFFIVRRNREDFTKPVVIAYSVSIVILIVLFFLLKGK